MLSATQSQLKPLAFVDETCVMRASKQCVVEYLHGKDFVNWIQCTSCHSWYHDACVGLSTDTLPTTFVFSCCSAHQQNSSMSVNNAMFIVHIIPSCVIFCRLVQGKTFCLQMSDLVSVYHCNGISDAIIDFYVR